MEKIKVFKGANLFDGKSDALIENAVVIMTDDKFTAVGKDGEVEIPAGENVEIIDVTGKTIMPGLIETHMHLNLEGTAENSAYPTVRMNKLEMLVRSLKKLDAAYKMGFTTVRGGGDGWGWFEVAIAEGIKRGDLEGPRFQTAGYHLTVYGGHGCFVPYNVGRLNPEEQAGMYCDGPVEWRKAVRTNVWNHVNNIKVVVSSGFLDGLESMDPCYTQTTLEELSAAVDEAHNVNRKVIAHTNGKRANTMCLDAGVDIMTHANWLDEETAVRMQKQGVVWEPTTAVVWNMYRAATDTLPDYLLQRAPNNMPKALMGRVIECWEDKVKNFKNVVYNSGVTVLMGSDAGCPWLFHDLCAMELESSVMLGLKPIDALKGCTSRAAESLRMDDKVGSVEVGKLADLVVVDGDPLADVSILQKAEKILLVYKDGKEVVDRRA